MTHSYDELIHLPHPVPKPRRPMSDRERAAQFMPFAALTGYDEAVLEAAHLSQSLVEPNDPAALNAQLQLWQDTLLCEAGILCFPVEKLL